MNAMVFTVIASFLSELQSNLSVCAKPNGLISALQINAQEEVALNSIRVDGTNFVSDK